MTPLDIGLASAASYLGVTTDDIHVDVKEFVNAAFGGSEATLEFPENSVCLLYKGYAGLSNGAIALEDSRGFRESFPFQIIYAGTGWLTYSVLQTVSAQPLVGPIRMYEFNMAETIAFYYLQFLVITAK